MEAKNKDVGDADVDCERDMYWYCVQTHSKHETIAACNLRKNGGFEVFNPRMRIRRATRRGLVWFVESAFPSYLFVRFDLRLHLDNVRFSSSVSKVVNFRNGYPTISEEQITELRRIFGPDDVVILTTVVSRGDTVRIVGGAMNDLVAVVQMVKPATERVQVLLEFLGRMTIVETDLRSIVVENHWRPSYFALNCEASVGKTEASLTS